MYSLVLLFVTSFGACFLLTPIFRNLFRSAGLLDHPDSARKTHLAPVPRAGGIPILLSVVLAFLVLALSPLAGHQTVRQAIPTAVRFLPAVLVVFATGLIDDLVGLRAWQKFAGQAAAGVLAAWAGLRIEGLGSIKLDPVLGTAVTVFWLVACSNALNLIDGVDGLAAGVGVFSTITMLVAALLQGHYTLVAATAPLAGALLGFLRFNFNPASIFLGDCGSLTLGFLLGCYGVLWSEKCATMLAVTAPLMALAIPLLDTGLAILRRMLRGKPVFTGDRAHIHHKLLERGLSPRRVAILLYGVCGLAAAFSLLQTMASGRFAGVILVLFCLSVWMGVQHLGYVEFAVAGRLVTPAMFVKTINAQLRLRALESSLARARSFDECWEILVDACREFGFSRVCLRVNGSRYERHQPPAASPAWTLRIPLEPAGYVNVGHAFDTDLQPVILAPLAGVLRRQLCSRVFDSGTGLDTLEPSDTAPSFARSAVPQSPAPCVPPHPAPSRVLS